MKAKNEAAAALGRLAAGRPKKYSPAEIEVRKRRLAAARAKSPHPPQRCSCGKPVGAGVGDGLCIHCRFAALPPSDDRGPPGQRPGRYPCTRNR
jgi:hypothetical protein